MSLIKCPECGKEISSLSNACIHCGFPLKDINVELYSITINGFTAEKGKELTDQKVKTVSALMESCNLTQRESVDIVNTVPCTFIDGIQKNYTGKITSELTESGCIVEITVSNATEKNPLNDYLYRKEHNIEEPLRCPRCHSTSVVVGKRGYSLLMGFIGANKVINRCGKCGYKWEPRFH